MDFYTLLKKNRHLLNETEDQILTYLLAQKKALNNLTIRKVADDNYTVPNTIIRLCQKLGFSGYTAFKESFKQTEIEKNQLLEVTSLDEQLIKTKQLLSMETIDTVINHIKQADRILLFAVGLSRFPAEEFNERLRIINKNSQTFVDPHTMRHSARQLTNKDLAIAISISGETDTILSATNMAVVSGAPTISITGFSTNSLAKLTDHQLYAYISPLRVNGLDAADRLCVHYICNLLFMEYLKKSQANETLSE